MRYAFLLVCLTLQCPLALAAADASWMLSYGGKESSDLMRDRRTVKLVQDGVPADLAANLLPALGGVPGQIFVTDRRYLAVSGCVAHSCTQKGFLWVDTRAGTVLGAYAISSVVDYGSSSPFKYALALGSMELTADNVPAAALQALRAWIEAENLPLTSARFIGQHGSTRQLDASVYNQRDVLHLPRGGPAFDCAKARSRIEKEICANTALGVEDYGLSNQYEEVRKSLSTALDRGKLRDFQRQWLLQRNTRCASASDIRVCLSDEYHKQYAALGGWTPASQPAPVAGPAGSVSPPSTLGQPVAPGPDLSSLASRTGLRFPVLDSKIMAVLLPAQKNQWVSFAVTADGRHVYAATWKDSADGDPSAALLHVIDVADPARPVPLAQLALPEISYAEVQAAGDRLFIETLERAPPGTEATAGAPRGVNPAASALLIIDVSRPEAPRVLAHQVLDNSGIIVASDGSCFLSGSPVLGLGETTGYSVTRDGHIEPASCAAWPGSGGQALSQRGNDTLVRRPPWLLISSKEGASTADREVTVAGHLIGAASAATFLQTADAVLTEIADTETHAISLVVLDTARAAFDPARIKQIHAALVDAETRQKDGPVASKSVVADARAVTLGGAGLQQALGMDTEDLKKDGLVTVLADWGRWQSGSSDPASAIGTLQRVLEVEPARLGSWRDLGAAARRALADNRDPAERLRLTRIGLAAYAAYRQHGGRLEPDMADFMAFNATNAPQDLCQLVSGYARRGRLEEITGVTQPVDVDGRKLWLDVRYEGSGHYPALVALDTNGLVQLFGAAASADDIVFLYSGGSVYALNEKAGAPDSLTDSNGREVCDFSQP